MQYLSAREITRHLHYVAYPYECNLFSAFGDWLREQGSALAARLSGSRRGKRLARCCGRIEVITRIPALLGCLFVFSMLAASLASADGSVLMLTDEEYEANLDFRERAVEILQKPSDPLAPRIVIDRPDVGSDVAVPVDVAVRFEAAGDSEIDLGTLRIRYGWFDITDRVLESMEVSPTGITGKIRGMRRGKYSLKLSISDTMRRESFARIEFQIVEL